MGEESNAKVTSVDNTGSEVTTENGDEHPIKEQKYHKINKVDDQVIKVTTDRGNEVSVPESNDQNKIMKLKPPTIKDNPKLREKNNKKRKFEDE